ncbi:peroxidase [Ranunculus cassubicifolius]
MAWSTHSVLSISLLMIVMLASFSSFASAQLSVNFYATTCPSVFDTVRAGTRSAINREARMGASILRLFFHDCFVNGCDGSILLSDTGSFIGERTALSNGPSVRGFEVIDGIKAQVDRACGANIVSCADILAISARDSVVELGGQSYGVPLGRRDARTASLAAAGRDLPSPFDTLDRLITKFGDHGFTPREMVALSGAHTVGQAGCASFRGRIYNDVNIDPAFATARQANCPNINGTGDRNLAPLDPQSPNRFGNNYFQALLNRRGLLNSDQVLFNGGSTDSIVTQYSNDPAAYLSDFTTAMIKMGNMRPLTGTQGEIRISCQRIN